MSCCSLDEEPQQISKLPSRARCWAPLLHPLQEPELQTGLCNPRAAQAELQAELSAPRGAAELPSAHELRMRARIKLWHSWKTQALMHINLSHHLETPDLRGLSEPRDCVDIIHCYADTQLLLNLTFTLLAGFVSKHQKGRQK